MRLASRSSGSENSCSRCNKRIPQGASRVHVQKQRSQSHSFLQGLKQSRVETESAESAWVQIPVFLLISFFDLE